MTEAAATAIFFLAYELRPRTDADRSVEEIGGAFVSAWVKSTSLVEARHKAHQHLQSSGWTVLGTLKEAAVNPALAPETMRPFLERAQSEGEVYVLDAFPAEPADA